MIITPLAITDLPLEEGEVVFILILSAAACLVAGYVINLRQQLRDHKRQLEEQAKFNRKLNNTVDRLLKIDEAGKIDGNRHKQP